MLVYMVVGDHLFVNNHVKNTYTTPHLHGYPKLQGQGRLSRTSLPQTRFLIVLRPRSKATRDISKRRPTARRTCVWWPAEDIWRVEKLNIGSNYHSAIACRSAHPRGRQPQHLRGESQRGVYRLPLMLVLLSIRNPKKSPLSTISTEYTGMKIPDIGPHEFHASSSTFFMPIAHVSYHPLSIAITSSLVSVSRNVSTACKNRSVASTKLNEQSSRSHAILCIQVRIYA
ncbi:hypothetical protein BC936DRAFT_140025, partial [Jimgerdemannia flammicorona]